LSDAARSGFLGTAAARTLVSKSQLIFLLFSLCYSEWNKFQGGFSMKHTPGFLALVTDAKSRVKELNFRAVKDKLDAGEKFSLVDVREDNEWARGHLPGAVHLSKGIIERDIETAIPDKSAKLVLYCGGGFRSALAADNLQKMGYTNVISMDGGWRSWTEAGFPTEPAK
jgi:rhodanese-related sulfurtransferase